MEEIGFWVAAVLAAALVGMGKGGVPIVGMLSVPVMALVMNPVVAAGAGDRGARAFVLAGMLARMPVSEMSMTDAPPCSVSM